MSFELKYVCKINNCIPLYEDPYMDDDIILMNKADSSLTRFYICSPKVANTIYKVILRNERKQKLDYIDANIRSQFRY